MAALANATAGVALEMDEGTRLGGGHPAIHVLPGAIAVAEDLGSSGPRLAEAIIAGYEVSSRIGGATRALPNVHSHGTWGTIGTAVAVAKLMDFDPTRMRGVINLSASMSPANTWTPCFEGATIRNVYPGRSGMQGVLAPQLLLCGFTPPADAPTDVYTTILGDEFDRQAAVAGLGSDPLRIEQNYFKFHACCLYNHPVLDAVEAIAAREDINHAQRPKRQRHHRSLRPAHGPGLPPEHALRQIPRPLRRGRPPCFGTLRHHRLLPEFRRQPRHTLPRRPRRHHLRPVYESYRIPTSPAPASTLPWTTDAPSPSPQLITTAISNEDEADANSKTNSASSHPKPWAPTGRKPSSASPPTSPTSKTSAPSPPSSNPPPPDSHSSPYAHCFAGATGGRPSRNSPPHLPVIPAYLPVIPAYLPVIPAYLPVIPAYLPVIPAYLPVIPAYLPVIPA